ncbi:Squalene/phytoene synthase [Ostreococcus tauri]|uniref:15-cis-phytoene synthase n=1 Tax=Ostreococcus tauri TaxID=70448 RepID=A0A090MEY5_OSTTA|nr:Squalene/phytoene synthase [Ostreococcus tauri]CEG01557.1 Squalene/phytoene synthase [Ostreococcus tauri]|eukprot:XP_003080885.2 Squalene/phytoene synthase [Ostreococcus tauri]
MSATTVRRLAVASTVRTYAVDAVDDLRAALRHCVEVVRARDYETYLCTLALPRALAPAAFAIRALNCETGSIVGSASSSDAAVARLMWWSDALVGDDEGPGGTPAHPVARAVAATLGPEPSARARTWLKRMVEARIRDAREDGPPREIIDLERYASDAHGSAMTLALDACGIRNTDADHAASHLGKAIGLSALLRGTTAHSRQRRCYLPIDVCARHGVSTESVYRMEPSEGVRSAAHEVACAAKAHLDSARAMTERVPKEAKPFFLQAVTVGRYLDALEARDFDVFDETVAKGGAPLATQGAIAWHAFRGTY